MYKRSLKKENQRVSNDYICVVGERGKERSMRWWGVDPTGVTCTDLCPCVKGRACRMEKQNGWRSKRLTDEGEGSA